jgi:hypothetical protein
MKPRCTWQDSTRVITVFNVLQVRQCDYTFSRDRLTIGGVWICSCYNW